MLLKKQTVWLLTMLSLVVVLSVYYITSPEQSGSNMAAVDEEETKEENNKSSSEKTEAGADEGGSVVSGAAADEIFESLRLDLEEERSKQKEALRDTMASTDLPADKRSEAFDEIQKIDEISRKEALLETLIIAMGYKDALVRADGEKVRITVKSDKHSPEKANEIIQMVKNEIGEMQMVSVTFQPEK